MAAHGGVFTLNQADQQGISGYNSGNPDLKAEKGRSTTVGLVVTPRGIPMLRKFTFTADYFLIKIADAIVATDRQYALDQCYNHNNPVFCSFIVRRPAPVGNLSAGSIQYSNLSVTNSGGLGTEGGCQRLVGRQTGPRRPQRATELDLVAPAMAEGYAGGAGELRRG
jgi:outer membrane receptor protein involved in Fe transport